MRRPRSKLEVSTFPFLAVLLCAMGSLLLLLFIMDRRAKVAAQNNARETLAARKKRSQEEEAARLAAWEKAKEQLHQALLLQHEELGAEVGGVNDKLNSVAKGIVLVQSRHVELDQQVKDEKNKIATIQVQLAERRDALKTAEAKETMSKAELLEATKELAELELAFMMMKSLKEREKEIYSVVPYRGKRGDMRPPIYIECVRSGVIFHPEKKMLQFWEIRPEAMREEVERQAGPLRARQAILEKGQTTVKGPYVLFLIRPDGITHYYKAQAALRGYQLDFGYELVDENWVLDFTLDPYAKNQAKTNSLPDPRANAATGFGASSGSNNVGSGRGDGPGGGYGGTNGNSSGAYPGNGGSGKVGPGGAYPGNGGSGAVDRLGSPPLVGIPGAAGPAGASLLPPPPTVNLGGPDVGAPGLGASMLPPPPPLGVNSSGTGFGAPGIGTAPPPLGVNPTGNVTGVPGGNGPPGLPGASNTAPSQSPNGNSPYPAPDAKGPSFALIARTSGPNASPSVGNLGAVPTPGNAGTGAMTPQLIASAGPANPLANPPPTPAGDVATSRQPAGAATTPNGQATGAGGSHPASSGASGDGDGSPGMPGPRPLPTYGAEQPRKTASPAPLSKMLGNKDFLITIDCFGDHVNVFPGGTLHRWTQANTQAADQLLVQTITNLIARRQASVRPGEPPYQPLIRFQVSAEGLRTYYHAYPLLEHLRVPMSRENVVE